MHRQPLTAGVRAACAGARRSVRAPDRVCVQAHLRGVQEKQEATVAENRKLEQQMLQLQATIRSSPPFPPRVRKGHDIVLRVADTLPPLRHAKCDIVRHASSARHAADS